jgi:hypothetical protein
MSAVIEFPHPWVYGPELDKVRFLLEPVQDDPSQLLASASAAHSAVDALQKRQRCQRRDRDITNAIATAYFALGMMLGQEAPWCTATEDDPAG